MFKCSAALLAGLFSCVSLSASALNSESFCKGVAEDAGGSYVVFEQCMSAESKAKSRVSAGNKTKSRPKIKRLSDKEERMEVEEDLFSMDYLITQIPEVATTEAACNSQEEAEIIKSEHVQLALLYEILHDKFPIYSPGLMKSLSRDQETITALRLRGQSPTEEWCRTRLESGLYTKNRLHELLKSAFDRAFARNHIKESDRHLFVH